MRKDNYCGICSDMFSNDTLADRIRDLRNVEATLYLYSNFVLPMEMDPYSWDGDALYRQRGYLVPGE